MGLSKSVQVEKPLKLVFPSSGEEKFDFSFANMLNNPEAFALFKSFVKVKCKSEESILFYEDMKQYHTLTKADAEAESREATPATPSTFSTPATPEALPFASPLANTAETSSSPQPPSNRRVSVVLDSHAKHMVTKYFTPQSKYELNIGNEMRQRVMDANSKMSLQWLILNP